VTKGYPASIGLSLGDALWIDHRVCRRWGSFNCSVFVWPHHIPASAWEVTTLWRYINQFILLLLLLLLLCPT